ncbi:hypothetical protein BDF21DRAFT_413244, partial [Thamnidium elegans]
YCVVRYITCLLNYGFIGICSMMVILGGYHSSIFFWVWYTTYLSNYVDLISLYFISK